MSRQTGFSLVEAFRVMVRMRTTEESIIAAWHDGLVPGEYHAGIGEEAANAGVVMHLSGHDTMALDHRNTAPLVARGADLVPLMLEVMGSSAGMNGGQAGHMHLMEPSLHAAADGIVGASGPLAVGNATALTRLHPGSVAVAFHGEAAMNQGMLLESYNMAAAWNLPVVFVCKDNNWSITTYSKDVTGGDLTERARAFGLAVESAAGERVEQVYRAAGKLIDRARRGKGPGFLYVTCHRPGGHFEGDPLARILDEPRSTASELGPGIVAGVRSRSGARRRDKTKALAAISRRGALVARDRVLRARLDPIRRARRALDTATAEKIEANERAAVAEAAASARALLGARPVFGTGRTGSQ